MAFISSADPMNKFHTRKEWEITNRNAPNMAGLFPVDIAEHSVMDIIRIYAMTGKIRAVSCWSCNSMIRDVPKRQV